MRAASGLLSGGRGDVVILQAVLDVWSWGEGRHDVTKDVAVRAEVLEDFLQVLLLTVSALRCISLCFSEITKILTMKR